ncbi:hypothetical protein F4782DRAFT_526428 [Xylaria castorea]|nr:hypothetical protein F4782DRAFT_526428 [Xylaria castorea]
MAAPIGKPAKTSHSGRPNKPIYARTSVLCNGQIVQKVKAAKDMEYSKSDVKKAELRSAADVQDDLMALNGLQMYRAKPLTPLEVKQPLRHVQYSLPKIVKARIYTGDLCGSAEGVFSCPDNQFETRAKRVFENEVRADGDMNYNDFFRRLRRAEWLLWDVEAEKGRWVAVIAHLHESTIRNPDKKFLGNDAIPPTITSPDFNRIDEWCVVTAQRSPEGDAMVDRVKNRLPIILRKGNIGIDKNSEIKPAIWIPTDETNWSSGLRVYALIKTLMHRVTEFHCTRRLHRPTFWHPVSGWLNVDEVRAEMQGRAAQRCMAATDYRSRIAIEGVHRWIGTKEVVLAKELRPRHLDNQAYCTGKVGEDGRCIPVEPYNPDSDSSDGGPDDDDVKGGDAKGEDMKGDDVKGDDVKGPDGQSKGEQDLSPNGGQGGEEDPADDGPSKPTPPDNEGKQPSHTQNESDVNKFGGPFKRVNIPEPRSEGQTPKKKITSRTQNKFNKTKFSGPLDPPPSKVHGWNDDTTDDGSSFQHIPLTKLAQLKSSKQKSIEKATPQAQKTQSKLSNTRFAGPLDSPPSKVHGWDDNSTDDDGSFKHIPLTKLALLNSSAAELPNQSGSKSLKELVTPSELSSVKGTGSKLTEGNNQAKQDPKGKRKQVNKHEKNNSKRKAQEAAIASSVEEVGDDGGASKKRLKADSPKPGLQDLLSLLDSP